MNFNLTLLLVLLFSFESVCAAPTQTAHRLTAHSPASPPHRMEGSAHAKTRHATSMCSHPGKHRTQRGVSPLPHRGSSECLYHVAMQALYKRSNLSACAIFGTRVSEYSSRRSIGATRRHRQRESSVRVAVSISASAS